MPTPLARLGLAVTAMLAAGPVFAQQTAGDPQLTALPAGDRLDLMGVFAHAGPVMKVVLFGLLAVSLIALAVWIVQLARPGERRSHGAAAASAWLSAVAAAAPLIGFFGAAYAALNGFIGISNVRPTPSLTVLAPGLAEAMLSVGLGLLAAAIATIGARHLRAKPINADAVVAKAPAETSVGGQSHLVERPG